MKKQWMVLFALITALVFFAAVTAQDTVPETWTCVNGHEGNTGKFCTQCGAKRP